MNALKILKDHSENAEALDRELAKIELCKAEAKRDLRETLRQKDDQRLLLILLQTKPKSF